MKIVDVTHTFTSDIPVYPGDPKSTLEQVASINKDSFNDYKLLTVMHVGAQYGCTTALIENGAMIDSIPPERFIGKGIVVDVQDKDVVDKTV